MCACNQKPFSCQLVIHKQTKSGKHRAPNSTCSWILVMDFFFLFSKQYFFFFKKHCTSACPRQAVELCTGTVSISSLLASMCSETLCPRTPPITAEHEQHPDCASPLGLSWSCSHRVVINDSKACSQCPLCKLAQAALLKQPLCGTGMFLCKKGNGVGFPRGTFAFGGLLPSSTRGCAAGTLGRGWQNPAALLQARLFALGERWLYYLCNNKLRGCRYCSG